MQYAGFLRRLAAYAIDFVIVYGVLFVVFFVFGATGLVGADFGEGGNEVLNVLFIVATWIYFALLESSRLQASPGKLALGIKVTDMAGGRISFGRASGRYVAKILSGLILLIGYIMIAFTAKKQGLHDILAKTLVVMK